MAWYLLGCLIDFLAWCVCGCFAAACVQRCMGDHSVYAVSLILAWWPSVKGSLTAGLCPREKRLCIPCSTPRFTTMLLTSPCSPRLIKQEQAEWNVVNIKWIVSTLNSDWMSSAWSYNCTFFYSCVCLADKQPTVKLINCGVSLYYLM